MVKQLNIRIIELHKASPWPTEECSVIGKTDIKQIAAKNYMITSVQGTRRTPWEYLMGSVQNYLGSWLRTCLRHQQRLKKQWKRGRERKRGSLGMCRAVFVRERKREIIWIRKENLERGSEYVYILLYVISQKSKCFTLLFWVWIHI